MLTAPQRRKTKRVDIVANASPSIPAEPFLALDHDPELGHDEKS